MIKDITTFIIPALIYPQYFYIIWFAFFKMIEFDLKEIWLLFLAAQVTVQRPFIISVLINLFRVVMTEQ